MQNIGPTKKNVFKLVASLLVLGLAVLLSVTAWTSNFFPSSTPGGQQSDARSQRREKLRTATIAIENRTSSLEVVSVDKFIDQGVIAMVLRNGYPRPVTGYKFSHGISIDYSERLNSKWIEPGGEIKEFLPLQLGLDTEGIKILAVIFDDESTDGDPQFVREIHERREGARTQHRRTLSLLKQAMKSGDLDLLTALSSLESKLAQLSVEESVNLSPDEVAGLSSERYMILQELNRIRMASGHRSGDGVETIPPGRVRSVRDGLNKLIEELSQRRY